MYVERLQQISQRIRGSLALSLVDRDGIPVESVSSDPTLDLELLAAELLLQVRAVGENHQDLAAGPVRLFSVTTDQRTLMVSSLTREYFLLLVLGAQSSYGQARLELSRARLLFENDL
ncbi:MAG: hypothetical protein AAGD01_07305 [Acidobacteriota bacterium]